MCTSAPEAPVVKTPKVEYLHNAYLDNFGTGLSALLSRSSNSLIIDRTASKIPNQTTQPVMNTLALQ